MTNLKRKRSFASLIGFRKKSVSEQVLYTLVFLFFAAVAFSYAFVFVWCVYAGMRVWDNAFIAQKLAFKFSAIDGISNFAQIFSKFTISGKYNFITMFFNSMYFSFLGPFCCIFVTSAFAYVTNKYKFFGSKAIYFIVFIVITLPIYGSGAAMYKLLYNTGIINSYFMILTSLNGFSIYYLYFYAFFSGVSWSYAEAAEIDGANEWQIYFRVMLPQSVAMFGSLFLMLWIADWNNYSSALLYLYEKPTLAVGIYRFHMDAVRIDNGYGYLFAACTVTTLPPLILFMICNGLLLSNVSLGGIKE